MKSIGVLCDRGLYARGGVLKMSMPTVTAGQLCALGIAHNLHTVWVLPGSMLSHQVLRDPESLMQQSTGYDVRTHTENIKGKQLPTFGSVKALHGSWDEKRIVYFGFPEFDFRWMTDDETWALADLEHPIALRDTIEHVEDALTPRKIVRGQVEQEEYHVTYSPGKSGIDLLKATIKLYSHFGWMRDADLSMLPECSEPGGFVWKRALTDAEKQREYIHFFDRNAQFPAAATGAECGEGTPEHTTEYDPKLPGVWKIKVFPPEASNLGLLPPFPIGEQWAYTPTIEAMELLGYSVEFIEGYQWTTHHRTLQDWAKLTWEARLAVREKWGKGCPEEHMIKMIANQGLGWLDLGIVRQEKRQSSEPYNRPDMYNMVRSLARYRMVLKLLEYGKKGYYPCVIVQDNIAYLSDDPNPETAVPGLMVRCKELGGFKHDGTYLAADVIPLLEAHDPNTFRKHVKKLEKITHTIENLCTSVGDKDIDAWLERQV